MDEPKFCKDCAKYIGGECDDQRNKRVDLVRSGMKVRLYPYDVRSMNDLCGPEAKWFVGKVPA